METEKKNALLTAVSRSFSASSHSRWRDSDAGIPNLLWNSSSLFSGLVKKGEIPVDQDISVRSVSGTDSLERSILTTNTPNVEFLEATKKAFHAMQKDLKVEESSFAKEFVQQAFCVARRLQSVNNFKREATKKKARKNMKNEEISPISSMAIKTGLAFFFSMLKRCALIPGASEVLTDMLEAMNEILLEFEPLSLYHNPPPKVAEDGLDKVTKFIHSCITKEATSEIRTLCITFLCNLSLQRGNLSSIANFILFLKNQDENEEIACELFRPLLLFLLSLRIDCIQQYKEAMASQREIEAQNENSDATREVEGASNGVDNENVLNDPQSLDSALEDVSSDIKREDIVSFPESEQGKETKKENEDVDSIAGLVLDKNTPYCDIVPLIELVQEDVVQKEGKLKESKISSKTEKELPKDDYYDNEEVDRLAEEVEKKERISFGEMVRLLSGCLKDLSKATMFSTDGKFSGQKNRHSEDLFCYGWGGNSYNQMAGSNDYNIPTRLPLFESIGDITQVECGNETTFVVTEGGMVYGIGKGDYGRLGIGSTSNISVLTPLPILTGIIEIAISKDSYGHGLAINENGEIWSWGDGDYYKLGHGDTSQKSTACKIQALVDKKIVKVSCGHRHSACVTDEGKVYTWGTMSSEQTLPTLVTNLEDIRSVHCGNDVTFAIDATGNLFGWGSTDNGHVPSTTPHKYEELSALGISFVSCSATHIMALTKAGDVYMWGIHDSTTPEVMDIHDVTFIAAGSKYAVFLKGGEVYGWGGFSLENFASPTFIESLSGISVGQISASTSHCVLCSVPSHLCSSGSSIVPLIKSPFVIQPEKAPFELLKRIFTHSDTSTSLHCKEASYPLECYLHMLRANLYHMQATGGGEGIDLTYFRTYLFTILNGKNVPASVFSVCKEIFRESWEILIPSLEMKANVLLSLLPANEVQMKSFNDTESFLLQVIVESLVAHDSLATLFLTNMGDSQRSDFHKKILDFLLYFTFQSVEHDEALPAAHRSLQILLEYFHEHLMATLVCSDSKDSSFILPFLHQIFISILSILDKAVENGGQGKENLKKILHETLLYTLFPFEVLSLLFVPDCISDSFIMPLEKILQKLDVINRGDASSSLLAIERIIAFLLGEFQNRKIHPKVAMDAHYEDLLTSTLFSKGTSLTTCSVSMDLASECMEDLFHGNEASDPLFEKIQEIAQSHLLLDSNGEIYPPLKKLVCSLVAAVCRQTGQEHTALAIQKNQCTSISPEFTTLISVIFILRENILSQWQKGGEEEKQLEEICSPLISRATFLFYNVKPVISSRLSLVTDRFLTPCMDLRSSAPVFADLRSSMPSFSSFGDDDLTLTPKKEHTSKIRAIAAQLRKLQVNKEASGLLRDCMSFIKNSAFSIDIMKEIINEHNVKAKSMQAATENVLSKLSGDVPFADDIHISYLSASLRLLFNDSLFDCTKKEVRAVFIPQLVSSLPTIKISNCKLSETLVNRAIHVGKKFLAAKLPTDRITFVTLLRALDSLGLEKNITFICSEPFLGLLLEVIMYEDQDKVEDGDNNHLPAAIRLLNLILITCVDHEYVKEASIVLEYFHIIINQVYTLEGEFFLIITPFLDIAHRCAIHPWFCKEFTSPEWLELLFKVVEDGEDEDRFFALRLLTLGLPHLEYPFRLQEFSSITKRLFSLLSLPFTSDELDYLPKPPLDGIPQVARGNLCEYVGEGSTECPFQIIFEGTCKEMDSNTSYITFTIEPEVEYNGTITISEWPEDLVLTFSVGTKSTKLMKPEGKSIFVSIDRNGKIVVQEGESSFAFRCFAKEFRLEASERVTMEWIGTIVRSAVDVGDAPPTAGLREEIVTNIRRLFHHDNWSLFIHSFLVDAFKEEERTTISETEIETSTRTRKLHSLLFMGGVFSGARCGSVYSLSQGKGILQYPGGMDSSLFVEGDWIVEQRRSVVASKSPITTPFDASLMVIDESFLFSICSCIVPVTEHLSLQEMEMAVAGVKTLHSLLHAPHICSILAKPSLHDSLTNIMNIACLDMPTTSLWFPSELERMIHALTASLTIDDPQNLASVIEILSTALIPPLQPQEPIDPAAEQEERKEEKEEEKKDEHREIHFEMTRELDVGNVLEDNSEDSLGIEESEDGEASEMGMLEDMLEEIDTMIAYDMVQGPEIDLSYGSEANSSTNGSETQYTTSGSSVSSTNEYSREEEEAAPVEFIAFSQQDSFEKFFILKRNIESESRIEEQMEEIRNSIPSAIEQFATDPFSKGIRSTERAHSSTFISASMLASFGTMFGSLDIEGRRTSLLYLQKALQIQIARNALALLLTNQPAGFTLDDNQIMICLDVIRKVSSVHSQEESEQLIRAVISLGSNQTLLIPFVSTLWDQVLLYSMAPKHLHAVGQNNIDFQCLLPFLSVTLSMADLETKKNIYNWLCIVILSPAKGEDRAAACSLLVSDFHKESKRIENEMNGSEYIKELFSQRHASILVANIFQIFGRQKSSGSGSTVLPLIAALAYLFFKNELNEEKDEIERSLQNYFLTLETAQSFLSCTSIPKKLSSQVNRKPGVLPEEDNKRWTEEMDRQLLAWRSSSPGDWRESTVVFLWGSAAHNELGEVSGKKESPMISNAFGTKEPVTLAGGESCSFILSSNGSVWGVGKNEYGRLGVGDTDNRRELTKLPFPDGIFITRIHAAIDSYGFAMALDRDGALYSWGDGDYGKLGHGDRNQRSTPSKIMFFDNESVIDFHCGPKHGAAVTKEGKVFTWGEGDDGRLGNGNNTKETPSLVEIDDVCSVACGGAFTIVLTNGNTEAFSWGRNDMGQLGIGSEMNASVPTKVEFPFVTKPFVKVDAGLCHSAFLCSDGRLYTCGSGADGALGVIDICNQNVPKQVEIEGQFIVDVACGRRHTVALTREGRVYCWGNNDEGQLGLGHTNDVYYPEESILPGNSKKVTSIAAGSEHSLAFLHLEDISKLVPQTLPEEYSLLQEVFGGELVLRAKILSKFSEMFFAAYPLIDLNPDAAISFGIEKIVWRFSKQEKLGIVRQYIAHTQDNSDDHGPSISLNRWLADHDPKKHCVFLQVDSALENTSFSALLHKRAWRVELVGEGSIDAGGPYNDSISQMCNDIQSGFVPIMQPTPNRKTGEGDYQNCVFPNAMCDNDDLFLFFGCFLGIGVRSKSPLSFEVPPCFWKLLLGNAMDIHDLEQIDFSFVSSHNYLLQLASSEEEEIESLFESLPLENFPPVLSPDNRLVSLTFSNSKEYVEVAFARRLGSWKRPMKEIRKGLLLMLPLSILRLFDLPELDVLFCGEKKFDWELLKSCTNYSGITADHDFISWLWEVLAEFSMEDSCSFLRFVCGKSRLPLTSADFSDQFEIDASSSSATALPTGTTCSFRLSIPQYPSKDILKEKLLYAVRNCISIDTDNNAGGFNTSGWHTTSLD